MGLARKLLRVFEKVDNKPVALPVGFKPNPEADRLHHLMRHLIRDLEVKGVIPNRAESFEESLDFNLPDDEDGDVILGAHLSSGISQSELRYMEEEKMLTEATEVANMNMQRRAAIEYKESRHGKKDQRRSGGSERSGDGVNSDVAGNAPQERRSSGEQAGK